MSLTVIAQRHRSRGIPWVGGSAATDTHSTSEDTCWAVSLLAPTATAQTTNALARGSDDRPARGSRSLSF